MDCTLPKNNRHCCDYKRVVKTAQLTLIFVCNGPHASKILWTPRWYYTNSFTRKCKFAYVGRRSVGPPAARGPIGSNPSNRLKAGRAHGLVAHFISVSYLKLMSNSHKTQCFQGPRS